MNQHLLDMLRKDIASMRKDAKLGRNLRKLVETIGMAELSWANDNDEECVVILPDVLLDERIAKNAEAVRDEV